MLLRRIITVVCLISITCTTQAQEVWTYYTVQTIKSGNNALFSLEYGIKSKGYNGYVTWKFTNHTSTTLYDVSIGRRIYVLKDGKVEKVSAQNLKSKINPFASYVMWPSDPVNSDENYGSWSDKNDNPVRAVELEEPKITFRMEKNGMRITWDLY